MGIFDGTQPPAWLVDRTRQKPGQLGDIAGLAFGGLLNAVTGDESFKEGLAEGRSNQQDPQWKLKSEALKAQILGQVTQNEVQYSKLREQNQELSAWQQAFPQAAPWLSATPDQRETMPTPDSGGSKQLLSAIEKTRQTDAILKYKMDQAETAKMRAEGGLFEVKEGQKAIEPLGAAARALIGPPKGPNGTYTFEQWGEINNQRSIAGLDPAGTPAGVLSEKERQKGRLQLEGVKQEGRLDLAEEQGAIKSDLQKQAQESKVELEKMREAYRKDLQAKAQEYKIDLTKLQAALKVQEKGKNVTKGEFVNRQLHGVYQEIMKAGIDEKVVAASGLTEAELAMRQARDILEKLYDTSTAFKVMEPPAAPATNAPPKTAISSKPAAQTTDPSDPMGLFK